MLLTLLVIKADIGVVTWSFTWTEKKLHLRAVKNDLDVRERNQKWGYTSGTSVKYKECPYELFHSFVENLPLYLETLISCPLTLV